GEVVEIVRGEKRRILQVRILADKKAASRAFQPINPSTLSRDHVVNRLLDSGAWVFIRQRPYSFIARPNESPKAIFVSGFDSAPLAPDLGFILEQSGNLFQAGLDALAKLTDGKVHLGLPINASSVLQQAQGVTKTIFNGPHPAGNVGVQIHHVDPINPQEVVWYVHAQDVVNIGRLFAEGVYRPERIVALTGSEATERGYFRTIQGVHLKDLLNNRVKTDQVRLIQGHVLTGQQTSQDAFLSAYTHQITAIPEGNHHEFLGWLTPGFHKLSLSRTFFSWLNKNKSYRLDTNLHGEERAFVVTGQYEQVLPMDILPTYLLKAILANDLEKMEQLGIYEVSEEDFALCEFVCTSKINVQKIISDGLEMVRKEG
ncbi:MAG TPA: NADH:ubiquinone reductase (Na(+)-transporting) subunit A, partial [Bacteroidetes bacterium]|nr:NADH:ubiquinone reductase (Na(+)-transporting) subunit A [Bacteroidota bacterium]